VVLRQSRLSGLSSIAVMFARVRLGRLARWVEAEKLTAVSQFVLTHRSPPLPFCF